MKPKELYKILLTTGAKISSAVTTSKVTPVEKFIEDKVDRALEKHLKDKELPDEWCDIWTDIYELGFVKGYVVGQLFDFTDPEILRNLEVIKKELLKEGLFDFVPRVRKSRGKEDCPICSFNVA